MGVRIKKNDEVEVISGNFKGVRGKVLKVIPKEDKVIVERVNIRWKHVRPSRENPRGGRIRKEMPIHISNVQPICKKCNKPVKVSYKITEEEKIRVCRVCKEPI